MYYSLGGIPLNSTLIPAIIIVIAALAFTSFFSYYQLNGIGLGTANNSIQKNLSETGVASNSIQKSLSETCTVQTGSLESPVEIELSTVFNTPIGNQNKCQQVAQEQKQQITFLLCANNKNTSWYDLYWSNEKTETSQNINCAQFIPLVQPPSAQETAADKTNTSAIGTQTTDEQPTELPDNFQGKKVTKISNDQIFAIGAQTLNGQLIKLPDTFQGKTVVKTSDGQKDHIQGRFIVKFGENADREQQILHVLNARVEKEIPQLGVKIIQIPSAPNELAVLNALQQTEGVEFAEFDELVRPDLIPNDPLYSGQWGLQSTGGINAPPAWDISTGSPNVIIAILDSGADATHEDLAAKVISGWNFYNNNSNTTDLSGHGTAVAGVAAASSNNSIGVASVAWGSKIMPIKVTDENGFGVTSLFVQGLVWAADHNARVANISFTVSGNQSIRISAEYFQAKGGIVVTSAGNTYGPSGYSEEPYFLTVGATYSDGTKAPYSTYGANVDLAAPGTATTTSRGGGYGGASGTSMSAPYVAGVAALLLSKNPGLTPKQVEDILKHFATDLGQAGYDESFGWGRVNAGQALANWNGTGVAPPAPLLGFPANGSTQTSLTHYDFNWFNVTDPTGVTYRLQIDNNGSSFLSPEVDVNTTNTSSYMSFAIALPAGTYSWRVRATDGANNAGVWSSVRTVTNSPTDTQAPTIPILLNPSNGGSTQDYTPAFDWNDSNDQYPYQVQYQLQVDNSGSSFPSPEINITTWNMYRSYYTPTEPLSVGTYSWRVRAFDASGNYSAWSSVFTFTITPDTTPPPAPTPQYPTNGSVTQSVYNTYQWTQVTDNANVVTYQFQLDNSTSAFPSPEIDLSGHSDNFADYPDTLYYYHNPGTYYWRARATDQAGNVGAWSSVWNVTVAPDTTPPPAPALLSPPNGNITTNTTPWFDWSNVNDFNNVNNFISYEIQIDNSGPSFPSPETSKRVLSSDYTPYPPFVSGSYWWRVRAFDCVIPPNASPWSTVYSFTISSTAVFYRLTVTKSGTGTGLVYSGTPSGIDIWCGSTCSALFEPGTLVNLYETPDTNSAFSSWSGGCTGTGEYCTATMDANKTVNATFNSTGPTPTYSLSVTKSGTGTGTVASTPGGIDCGSTCSAPFSSGTLVTLTATPNAGSAFSSWSGACTGTGNPCTVTMDVNKTTNATFTLDTSPPTVSITSPTNGATVTGTININANASDNIGVTRVDFYRDTNLIGTDTNSPYSISWDTTSVSNGQYSLTAKAFDAADNNATSTPVTVTVNNIITYSLSVSKSGTGAGTITSSPSGINCGTTCTTNFPINTTVTLTATPETGSILRNWTGACEELLCGNGTIDPGEQCDDGGICTCQEGGSTENCPPTFAPVHCTTNGNQCSLGTGYYCKTYSGDGCDAYCQIEPNKIEPSEPTTTCTIKMTQNKNSNATFNDIQNPTTSITSPTNEATVSGTININANASDNIGITKVEFYYGTTLIGTDTNAPYSIPWNTTTITNGSYSLTSVAYDLADNTGTSTPITITVNNDTTGPALTITTPQNGITLPPSGTIDISATATDPSGINKIELYANTTLIKTCLGSPTTTNLTCTKNNQNVNIFPSGTNTITAKSWDNSANQNQTTTSITVYKP
ncbi:MAG: Ig-like domain-containing protein [Candidatus Micrarchaeota archaeon]